MTSESVADNVSTEVSEGRQALGVQYKHWKTRIEITNPTTSEPVYILTTKKDPSPWQFIDSTGQKLGSTSFHTWSSKVDIEIRDRQFQMNSSRLFSDCFQFTSPSLGDVNMTWKNKVWTTKINYTLLDDKETALAWFESAPFTKAKVGKLEVADSVKDDEHVMAEIALTIMSLLYGRLRTIEDTAIAVAVS